MRGVSVKREAASRLGAAPAACGRPCLRGERAKAGRRSAFRPRAAANSEQQLWVPPGLQLPNMKMETAMNSGAPASASSGGYDEHRATTPPPDLPSILLDARILWLGMPIVSAVR